MSNAIQINVFILGRFFSYFSIVNLEEADINREIQVGIPSVVHIGENILG